jgi:hypothetical protein
MLQRPSKPVARAAARGRPRPAGPQGPAKPPADPHSRAPHNRLRPPSGPGPAEVPANTQSATDRQSYLQWAGFMGGSPNEDFGAYFVDQETGGTTRYTWTPKPEQP